MKRRSMLGRVFRFFALRVVPLLMVAGILWSGYQVANAVARQVITRHDLDSRREDFARAATAMIDASAFSGDLILDPTAEVTIEPSQPTPTTQPPSPQVTPEITATAELTPELTPEETTEPSATPRPVATRTVTPTQTVTSTSTLTEPASTETPLRPLQVFVTNTPRPFFFVTNTPVSSGQGGAGPTDPPDTPTNAPTATASLTLTLTAAPLPTLTPTIGATATSRPLPTPFFPENQAAGGTSGGTAIPTAVTPVPRNNYDLLNILVLGGDDGLTEDNFNRTDTMLIVSINRTTGTVSMLSLPRDLYVWLPAGFMQRLNVAYAIGESYGWTDGGFGLLRQTILYNFGINVHYFVRLNFDSFRTLIDAIGGVDLVVDCAYEGYELYGGGVPPEEAVQVDEDGLVSLPVGYYRMSGEEALWYVRTRENSTDFDRGRRQQQLLRAIYRQMVSSGQLSLTNLPTLWDQFNSVVETDLGFEDVAALLPLALSLSFDNIESFVMIRTYHTLPWQTPDGDFVQLPIPETLRPLLEDFYQPPTDSQMVVEAGTVLIRNGTSNPNWELVAADRALWEGFEVISTGPADRIDYTETILIDRTGQQRGSSAQQLAQILNIRPENIRYEPDAEREADYEVILGTNYDSCPPEAAVIDTQ